MAGTFPSADIAGRLAVRDSPEPVRLRETGSGNPGAANAANVLGARWGALVLVADIAKAALASLAGRAIAGDLGAHLGGSAAVVGHCFPIWTGFRGGKGVAASGGQVLVTFPVYFPIDLVVAGVTVAGPWKSRALVATAVAALAWTSAGALWWRRQLPNAWGPRPSAALPLFSACSSAVILARFLGERSTPAHNEDVLPR